MPLTRVACASQRDPRQPASPVLFFRAMSQFQHHDSTIFSVPVRWTIRVLAWLAFLVASYLAWHAATGSDVAGCGVGSEAGCDVVLSSSWSKWLNVPVSLAGLACYAALAGFSALIGLTGPRESRWIDTLVVMLSTVAAGASIWFLALQAFAMGHFCPYCIVVDSIGIALGALVLWSALRSPSTGAATHNSGAGVMALRATMPGVARVAPLQMQSAQARPSIGIALGGAGALLAVLIGGQILRPSQTYRIATVALDKPINMNGTQPNDTASPSDVSPAVKTHVALRIPTDAETKAEPVAADADGNPIAPEKKTDEAPTEGDKADAESSAAKSTDPAPAETAPKRKRLVKFLGGKLTLDTYQHPIIGDPEAPHVIVELVSYDCPHCRKMHPIVQRSLRRYGNQVAILILPIPMEMKCNRLIKDPKASHAGACTTARMALAVAHLKPAAFRGFHDAMMADEKKPPSQAQSVAKAYGMVDSSKLPALTRGEILNKQVAQYVDLFETLQKQNADNKNFGLPIQILGDEVMSGSVEKAEDVYNAWEKNLGIKPL